MMPEQQQRILGYFIEEAKDHLNTIEQGLLNLQSTIQDPEMVSEVFRAAHSVKGGAAMLSLGSIQRTAHRLEDYFKVLKETPTTQVDRDLESMFLQVFDGLQALLEELQGPFGLTEDKATEVMTDIEPVFDQLEGHLNTLVAEAPASAPPLPAATASMPSIQSPTPSRRSEDSALKLVFSSDVPGHLREMLTLFKQADHPSSRQALQACCSAMAQIGEQFDLAQWCALTATTRQVVGNPDQTYRALAPIVIKELKRAQEKVLAGEAEAIAISSELEALKPVSLDIDEELGDIDSLLEDALSSTDESDLTDLFTTDNQIEVTDTSDPSWLETDTETPDPIAPTASLTDDLDLGLDALDAIPDAAAEKSVEPTVGSAELNSLADLFEGEVAGLESPWEDMSEGDAIAEPSSPDIDLPNDFSDLLDESLETNDADQTETDLADLFSDTSSLETAAHTADSLDLSADQVSDSPDNDFAGLFDDDVNAAETPTSNADEDPSTAGDLDAIFDDALETDETFGALFDDATEASTAISNFDDELPSVTDETTNAASASSGLRLAVDDQTLALETESVPANTEADSDFDRLFDTPLDTVTGTADSFHSEVDADAGFEPDADAVTPDTASSLAADSTANEADDLGAIIDPWTAEGAVVTDSSDDESALEALDELWDDAALETNNDESPPEAAVKSDALDSGDFAELDVATEAPQNAPDSDLESLMAMDTADAADDFDALFDETPNTEQTDELADLLDEPITASEDDAAFLDLSDIDVQTATATRPEADDLFDAVPTADGTSSLDDMLATAEVDIAENLTTPSEPSGELDIDDWDESSESQTPVGSDVLAEEDADNLDFTEFDAEPGLEAAGILDDTAADSMLDDSITADTEVVTDDDDFFSTSPSVVAEAGQDDADFDLSRELLTETPDSSLTELVAADNRNDVDEFFESPETDISKLASHPDEFLDLPMAAVDMTDDGDDDVSIVAVDIPDAPPNLETADLETVSDPISDELSFLELEDANATGLPIATSGNEPLTPEETTADSDQLDFNLEDPDVADDQWLDLNVDEAIASSESELIGRDELTDAFVSDAPDTIIDSDNLGDLDVPVNSPAAAPAMTHPEEAGMASPDAIEGGTTEDFDALESLLNDDAVGELDTASFVGEQPDTGDIDDIDALLVEPGETSSLPQNGMTIEDSDEFGDLEKLLVALLTKPCGYQLSILIISITSLAN